MKIDDFIPFDASRYLDDDESVRLYLAQAFEDGNPAEIQAALGDVAKALGMTALARESGIKREALYRALSHQGNAEFATIMKVLAAMGLHLTVTPSQEVTKTNSGANSKKASRKTTKATTEPTDNDSRGDTKKPRSTPKKASTRSSRRTEHGAVAQL